MFFFLLQDRGEGGRKRLRRWPEGRGNDEEARQGEGRRGIFVGGEGAKYFFSGPKCPPSPVIARQKPFSGPISRDIAILSLRYPISPDTFSGRFAVPQNGAIPTPLGT